MAVKKLDEPVMKEAKCELCNWFLSIDCIDKKEICENFDPVEEDEMLAIKCDKCGEIYPREEEDRVGSARLHIDIIKRDIFGGLIRRNSKIYDLCPKCEINFENWLNNTEVEEATDEEQAE